MLTKEKDRLHIAVLVPCYKRPEYTEKCIRALEKVRPVGRVSYFLWDDGSCDGTDKILRSCAIPDVSIGSVYGEYNRSRKFLCIDGENKGLRHVIRCFLFDPCSVGHVDIIVKIDNDCVVAPDYLEKMVDKFYTTDADILSPNVLPSNAALKYGKEDTESLGYRPSKIVGGLWVMKREVIEGVEFEHHDVSGIKGAVNILYQIVIEKEPKIGWVTDVVVQDIGHWSGMHPENIKNLEHLKYYKEVGRAVAWGL